MTARKAGGTARLNARLDEALNAKLEYLKRRTKLSVTDVIKRSIERYYEEVRRGGGDTQALLESSGFIGCAEGEPDLSSDYKRTLTDSLSRKT